MTKPIPAVTDPQALAALVSGLGGSPIPGRTFTFDLPLSKVAEVVPKINDLGIGVRKVSERVEQHATRLRDAETICTLELHRR